MYGGDRDLQTICAVSTPHGVGGISVLRISGPRAFSITQKIAPFLPTKPETHRVYLGLIKDPRNHEAIDEVLATYFASGKSFTGEEVLEISCHGSPFVCQTILNLLVDAGAKPADRGEFTYRAFMNGKLDLVQAESVLSLIESQSTYSSRLALRQLKGDLSNKLESVQDNMTWILAHAEAGIDFSTEDIEVVSHPEVLRRLAIIEKELAALVDTFKVGRILKDGFKVVLTGLPNVGKSSLLNLFLEDQRAIVTEIPGTTRDVIHGDTIFDGIKFTFLDTAGLRNDASDLVEQIGIKRSYEAQAEADFVLFIFDVNKGLSIEEIQILDGLDPLKTLILANKTDQFRANTLLKPWELALETSKFYRNMQTHGLSLQSKLLFVSALDKKTRSTVLQELVRDFASFQIENNILISNSRHFENLSRALENTRRSRGVVTDGLGPEFLALELKEALIAIQETLGERFDDQIMDRVFKEFCLGK